LLSINSAANDGQKNLTALSRQEFEKLKNWFDENDAIFPIEIADLFKRLLSVFLSLVQGAARAKQTLQTLRQAMGFLPKSEKGKAPLLELLSKEKQAEFDALKAQRDEVDVALDHLRAQKRSYESQLTAIRPREKSQQMDFELGEAHEMIFAYPVSTRDKEAQGQKVGRMAEFGRESGRFQVSYDFPKRINLEVVVTETEHKVETVTDMDTGKRVRASMDDVGPANFQFNWTAMANLMKLHVGFAIPMNRISQMIAQPEFSPSKIYRALEFLASMCVPIYLHLPEALSDASILSGDDTGTKILDTADAGDELTTSIDGSLDWAQPKANGKGDKKSLNVSLVVGKTEPDPRSTIRFFRTHLGSVGNLLTKILESRNPKAGPVIFQGDLSTTNLPCKDLRQKFNLTLAGCGAHARRPFWRYKTDDEDLCYFMARGFLILSRIEKLIDARGRTKVNVLKLRGRYGAWAWQAMKNRCQASLTGQMPDGKPFARGIPPNVWPPGSDLYKACNYLVNHFDSLTLYLKNPALQYTNNAIERALRIEKCMLSSSKFRGTKRGRVVLDILRTINATCTAARIDPTIYFQFIYKHRDELQVHPEKFTPFAVAQYLEKEIKQ
jgi:hypothetical protein